MDEPRLHHYVFAYVALRQLFLSNPMGVLQVLRSDQGDALLRDLWRKVCEDYDRSGVQTFSIQDTAVHRAHLGMFPVAVVSMPPPSGDTEAFMVALVLEGQVQRWTDEGAPVGVSAAPRYFTLEKGTSLDGGVRTALCEWTKDGSHANYGNGPEPNPEAFLIAISARVEQPAPPCPPK